MKFFTTALTFYACSLTAALPMQGQPQAVPDLFERDIESSQPDPAVVAVKSEADDVDEGSLLKRAPVIGGVGGPATAAAGRKILLHKAGADGKGIGSSVVQKIANDLVNKASGKAPTGAAPQNPTAALQAGRTSNLQHAKSAPAFKAATKQPDFKSTAGQSRTGH